MCLSAFMRERGTFEHGSQRVFGKILGDILQDLPKGKRDHRPTVFGHSLQTPCTIAQVLNTILRINKTTKYKDAAKAIHGGQGGLNKRKSELITQSGGIWDNLWRWKEHWIIG